MRYLFPLLLLVSGCAMTHYDIKVHIPEQDLRMSFDYDGAVDDAYMRQMIGEFLKDYDVKLKRTGPVRSVVEK